MEPPSGIALSLPFDEDFRVSQKDGSVVSLQRVLSPSALRTYLASLVLFQDQPNGMRDDGSFEFNGPGAILYATGATKHKSHKGYRFATKDKAAVQDHLDLFARTRVRSVGDLEAAAGDPRLDEISDRRRGKVLTYAHSRLIVGYLRTHYIQIPRAVIRLAPPDVPIGMGLAMQVRKGITAHVKGGGPIEVPLGTWLEACGIDAEAGARKYGRAFWDEKIDDLVRVAEVAKIGAMQSNGKGREATLSLHVSAELKQSYQPLIEATKKKAREKARGANPILFADRRKPK